MKRDVVRLFDRVIAVVVAVGENSPVAQLGVGFTTVSGLKRDVFFRRERNIARVVPCSVVKRFVTVPAVTDLHVGRDTRTKTTLAAGRGGNMACGQHVDVAGGDGGTGGTTADMMEPELSIRQVAVAAPQRQVVPQYVGSSISGTDRHTGCCGVAADKHAAGVVAE